MKKALGMAVGFFLLTSCGNSGNLGSDVSVGLGAYDAGANATVTKTITAPSKDAPGKEEYAEVPGKAAG
ncbi:hypothetical protein [Deinococcus sp. Marseille-Q6407]|uniref:hypothetical protein n=1 Tax=Deinococcus sp. Marseille-Q6407 TaxID=2969223 RepID=UPI0021C0DDF6|nr:hypothetical protein [Deinococcus sp. Marseille-Q6407]